MIDQFWRMCDQVIFLEIVCPKLLELYNSLVIIFQFCERYSLIVTKSQEGFEKLLNQNLNNDVKETCETIFTIISGLRLHNNHLTLK